MGCTIAPELPIPEGSPNSVRACCINARLVYLQAVLACEAEHEEPQDCCDGAAAQYILDMEACLAPGTG